MQICKLGIWDETIPGIKFDQNGVSNYAKIQHKLMSDFPRGKVGEQTWQEILNKSKNKRKNKKYDCIVGVSGGTDSSYLLHLLRKYNLRPLAVNLDNGWSSEIAVTNIKNITEKLNIDLETYVIDYEEIKDLMRSFMLAGLPWIDAPTDLAIRSILYLMAAKENIKYIFVGNDFRSEGKQPTEWTYSDQKQLIYLHNKFGKVKLKTYPIISLGKFLYLGYFRKIKLVPVYNYIGYQKKHAQEFLKEKYGWKYYGEHHHENLFTKFTIGYWQFKKFGIDKRKITYSAQVLSGEIEREKALEKIFHSPYDEKELKNDLDYILNKLGFSNEEFTKIWKSANHSFRDYPSYYLYFEKFYKYIWPLISQVVHSKPKIFYEYDERNKV
ncbi:N-acetyl sugar amidotransferase [Bacteroidota bacterium]